jgi:capsid protein
MGYGNIIGLANDESIELADPKRPNAAFDPFFVSIVKQIGAATGIPFEVLMLHFMASYSASRGAMLQFWKLVMRHRAWLRRNFCQPIYREWLIEAILRGRIAAPGFFLDPAIRDAWCRADWQGQGQGQIDPMKESEAAAFRIKNNLSTHTKEVAAIDGDDWDTMIEHRAREEKVVKDRGLKQEAPEPSPAAQEKKPVDSVDDPEMEE